MLISSLGSIFNGVYDSSCQYYNERRGIKSRFLGIILDYDAKTNMVTVEQRNYFSTGDIVEIFGPDIDTITTTISEIYDEKDNLIEVVRHPKQIVKIKIKEKVYPII